LSKREARANLIAQILQNESRIDLLVHCAGVGSHSKLNQLTLEEVQTVLAINTVAPLELTSAFLTLLPPGEPAGIVNIGSVAGELTMPGMTLYHASKVALHAFSRAVSMELADAEHFCLLVILGALRNTHFGDAIRHPADKQPGLYRRLDVYPEDAATRIVAAIERERSLLVIPGWYRIIFSLNRVLFPLTRVVTQFFYRRFR
jgi:short-subunit dehydrogenase